MTDAPSIRELKLIREYQIPDWQRARMLMAYVDRLWCRDHGGSVLWEASRGRVTLHTGGDGANEDLLGALQENELFWKLCWEKSERGGAHVFTVVPR